MGIISGTQLAKKLREEIKNEASQLREKGITPTLAVVLVGDNKASRSYVNSKHKACIENNINSVKIELDESITTEQLLEEIEKLNNDKNVHGILVQLPLPEHISEEKVLLAIDPEKDVDGFHPMNMGRLWSGNPLMIPSTPAGIMEMFREYNVELSGKRAVVIGRSNIVGKPMAQLLMMADATVTIAHSKTENLRELTKEADILVVAIGRDRMIKAEDIKEGAVVIDVGMNRDEDGKLHGDVDFDEVKDVASLITPVPGGVGPMTITMLMEQTVRAASRKMNENK